MEIAVNLAPSRRHRPRAEELGFGTHVTDHMFIVEFQEGDGWHSPRVQPYGLLQLDPRALALHYGCSVFEGLKIYRQPQGGLALFRPQANAARLNTSGERVALPTLPPELFLNGLQTLVKTDRDWAAQDESYTLYARPVMLGVQPVLGVQRPQECLFYILLTPTPAYYRPGDAAFRLFASTDLARGGTYSLGASKTSGNYAAMVVPNERARSTGYHQVLWLGGPGQSRIEEAGITNVFLVYADRVVTPPLNGRILPGVTRDSVITLLRQAGHHVDEVETDIDDVCAAIESGDIREIFLTGTATVIAPVSSLTFDGREHRLAPRFDLSTYLHHTLTGIQGGRLPDRNGWLWNVC